MLVELVLVARIAPGFSPIANEAKAKIFCF